MSRKLKLAIPLILSICIFILFENAFAKNKETFSDSTTSNYPIEDVAGIPPRANIPDLSEYMAEKGLRDLEPQSIILLNKGVKALKEGRRGEAIDFFKNAKELSPNLPQSYLYLAAANFSFSLKGSSIAVGYLLDAGEALLNNFWWSFQTAGLISISLYLSLYVSIILSFVILISSRFNLYIHDIIEKEKKILLIIPSIILVFFGPIFGIFAFMLPFWIYLKKKEKVLIYSLISITVFVILTGPFFSSFLSVSGDVGLRNIISVNSGLYTGDTHSTLNDGDDFETAFTYALDLKRKGYYKKAINVYKRLLSQKADAKVYNNIANCYVALNDYDTAMFYYNMALKTAKMASTYYNLSQLHREFFNFDDARKNYKEALNISPEKVVFYNSIRGSSINRFVMDEVFNNRELWLLAFKRTFTNNYPEDLGRMFSFTNKWISIFLIILIIVAFTIHDTKVSHHAYRCKRCGRIHCNYCEKKFLKEDVCLICYKTLMQMTQLSTKERIARIVEIHCYRENKNKRLKLLTLVMPGSGHIYYGWYTAGFLVMLLFTFFFFSFLLWTYSPLPVSMSQTATLFKWLSGVSLVLIYVISVVNVFVRVPQKWH